MSADLLLRPARADDARALAALSRDLIETGLGWKYDPRRVGRLIADADTVVLVASDAVGPVGFAAMHFDDERAHLLLLAVHPRRQRQGIARRLMAWLLGTARTAGIAELGLELRAGNAAGRAFYRALGFADVALLPGYYGNRESAIRMRLVLRSSALPLPAWRAPTLRRH